ncbi:uncharacterized protein LOC129572484 [Sitodiplosis mosellana]|uniref:uncharacterized protein LOC129572484 n=1 Tax=Sitodiplosis mosellana TaxID=263140 RepID=UPI00244416EB|nr:uncharacterized protein LOC129572484 [Sitodiplosis mosellana]
MFKFKYLSILTGTLLIIETNQLLIVPKVPACNVFCGNGFEINFETCGCVEKTMLNESEQRVRSVDSVSVSKLIRADVFASRRCANDEHWNGSACIATISLCPGGYHWNGRACIIQSSIQTAALVPSAPDTKCKYAKKQEKEAEEAAALVAANMQLPSTVMPTFSTSPMCPFGFIWSGNECVRNPPTCPSGYIYHENMCRLNRRVVETTTEPVTQGSLPSRENVFNGNKWQQKPFESTVNVKSPSRYDSVKRQHTIDVVDETEISQDPNGQPCCSIMTPRICRRISSRTGAKWQCYHHKYRRCGEFCSKSTIYLRPKQFSFNEPLLIMPPPPPRLMKLMQKHAYRETNIDCSGCINGTYGCSSGCFAYHCKPEDCDFIDEELFCENSTADDGSSQADDYEIDTNNDICAYTSVS